MASYFDLFVLYGIHQSFHINGSKKYYTLFSQIISIISIILILFFVIYNGLQLFNRKNPSIIRTVFTDEYPIPINLSKNFLFTFSLQYQNYTNYVNESIYTVTANYIKKNYDNLGNEIVKIYPIQIITCDKINISILKDYFETLSLNNLYCLENPEGIILEGDYGRNYWNYLTFDFKFCDEKNKNSNCEEKEKIIEMLKGGYFGMFVSDIKFNPFNYNNPVTLNGVNQYTTISSIIYKDLWVYFRVNQIETDSNLFFDYKKKEEYYGFDKSIEHYDMRNIDNHFMTMIVRASADRIVYSRNYKKFASISADIAGMTKFILICGNILVYIFENVYYKFFLFSFFDVKLNIKNKFDFIRPLRKYETNINILNVNKSPQTSNIREPNMVFIYNKNKSNLASEENSENILYNNNKSNSDNNDKLKNNLSNKKNKKDYTKELNFSIIMNIIFCKKEKIFNLNIIDIYRNISIYFEIIRFFKLYNDVEELKKGLLSFNDYNYMEINYSFSLHNDKTLNLFNNGFEPLFNKKNNNNLIFQINKKPFPHPNIND